MVNWQSIVDAFFRKADPENSFRHVVQPGASQEAIDAAETQIGISIPDELRSFYLCFNGIGLGWGDELDIPRFIRPIEDLPAYVVEARSWFAETHGNLASRFFAFIDWENGDVMGYLQQKDGTLYPCLVTFLHEMYKCDPAQDVNDFFEEGPESLAEFLS